jgi:hypothetical protein
MTDVVHGTDEEPLCLDFASAFDIAFQDSSVGQTPTSIFNIQPVFSTDQYEGLIFAVLPSSTYITASLSSSNVTVGGSVTASAALFGVTSNASGTVTYDLYPGGCSNNAVRM